MVLYKGAIDGRVVGNIDLYDKMLAVALSLLGE